MATIFDWPSIRASYISDYGFIGGKEVSVPLQSGGMYTATLSTTPRYKVTLHFNRLSVIRAAPAPYAAFSEARTVRDLLVLLKQGGVARMADPLDGTVRLWKLDGDYVSFRRVPKTSWYEAEVPLRSEE